MLEEARKGFTSEVDEALAIFVQRFDSSTITSRYVHFLQDEEEVFLSKARKCGFVIKANQARIRKPRKHKHE
jgi:hypothetical protein